MTLEVQRFECKQQPLSGKWLPVLLFLFGFVFIGAAWEIYLISLFWAASVISAFICWRKARVVIQVDAGELTIEVVKTGFRLPLSKSHFLWQHLEWFKYDEGTTDTNSDLELKWLDHPVLTFEGGDIKAFYAYLKTLFPEKDRATPAFRIG